MRRVLLSGLLLCSSAVYADAFNECPSRAFLTQGATAKTYGVNLVTGDYGLLQDDMATYDKVNATGFNPNDQFLYGWSYEHWRPVRIHSDFKIEPLQVDNISGTNFYVGDVSLTRNAYYVYSSSRYKGLYSISLDESSDDYLKMANVVSGEKLSLRIFDMAFHPRNGHAYAVDKYGDLHQIDVDSGESKNLGNVGESGTFGAVYFDVDGNLYISRNSDGKVFIIAIDNQDYNARLFAIGPSSGINDGSRCALAPVIDQADNNIDFGDAPASYGTLLKDNGARHGLGDGKLYLGSSVDGESDGHPLPLSDDTSDKSDDEDGVQFATGLQAGDKAILMVKSSGNGLLSGWIDSNLDGVFDADEQVITDKAVTGGKQPVYIEIPATAKQGETWARFRLSSSAGMQPTGGVADGEVEDYKVSISNEGTSVTHYPSNKSFTTVAFEDNWPFEGDYDMNDMIAHLKTSVYRKDGDVTLVNISGELAAVGAAYHNGFGIRLPGILRENIDADAISYSINDRQIRHFSPLESDRNEAIFILTYNTWNYVDPGEDCLFYRTEDGCGSDVQMRFNLTIPFKTPVESDISGVFDPFLFATPGAWHGEHFANPPGRSYEIHLKNQTPTEAFDYSFMNGSGEDGSNPDNKHYFQTKNGMPWAMEIGNYWRYPKEYRDITHAYPKFPYFVRSEGEEETAWYMPESSVESILFKD